MRVVLRAISAKSSFTPFEHDKQLTEDFCRKHARRPPVNTRRSYSSASPAQHNEKTLYTINSSIELIKYHLNRACRTRYSRTTYSFVQLKTPYLFPTAAAVVLDGVAGTGARLGLLSCWCLQPYPVISTLSKTSHNVFTNYSM